MAADTMTYENPFAYTAAGELGNNRDTMLQNELLLRVGSILIRKQSIFATTIAALQVLF